MNSTGRFTTVDGDEVIWRDATADEPPDVDRGGLMDGRTCIAQAYADENTPFLANALFCWRSPEHEDDHFDAADNVAWVVA